ncbi:MAG TPA: saccharopine dehydrogenase NADP-binding domain-containing protein, partial [Planctomycetota bacterium]|nr:saccharopine dehydrogenase NADP-binding domain-containing protein [Planctomycetota bacterium]
MSQSQPKAVVLGAGMVGTLMARDLARDGEFQVTLTDRSEAALAQAAARMQPGMQVATRACDLSNADTLHELARSHDVILGALSSHLGYEALHALCQTGKPYADISFMEENALDWHHLAQKHGSTCVVDSGV